MPRPRATYTAPDMHEAPAHLDLDRERHLTITWSDGTTSTYPIAWLRKMSPSADARELRDEMARNPLTILPSGPAAGPLTALDAELIGNYAIRIRFSDGHSTGIYTWGYLRSIDPARPADATAAAAQAPAEAHSNQPPDATA
ncbi:MAG: DUF971 domain-containing protein [Phycisphaerales bacterium]